MGIGPLYREMLQHEEMERKNGHVYVLDLSLSLFEGRNEWRISADKYSIFVLENPFLFRTILRVWKDFSCCEYFIFSSVEWFQFLRKHASLKWYSFSLFGGDGQAILAFKTPVSMAIPYGWFNACVVYTHWIDNIEKSSKLFCIKENFSAYHSSPTQNSILKIISY